MIWILSKDMADRCTGRFPPRNGVGAGLLVASALVLSGCLTSGTALERAGLSGLSSGILAGDLGRGLDDRDLRKALEAEKTALTSGTTGAATRWQGSAEIGGEVTPGQPYEVGSRICRRYTHTITDGADRRSATGTACRERDGEWQTLS